MRRIYSYQLFGYPRRCAPIWWDNRSCEFIRNCLGREKLLSKLPPMTSVGKRTTIETAHWHWNRQRWSNHTATLQLATCPPEQAVIHSWSRHRCPVISFWGVHLYVCWLLSNKEKRQQQVYAWSFSSLLRIKTTWHTPVSFVGIVF